MSGVSLKSFPQIVSDIKAFYAGQKPVDEHRLVNILEHLSGLTSEISLQNIRHTLNILNCVNEYNGKTLQEVVAFNRENNVHALSHFAKIHQPKMVQCEIIESSLKSVPDNTVIAWCDEALLVKKSDSLYCNPVNVVTKKSLGYGKFYWGFEGEEHQILGFIPE